MSIFLVLLLFILGIVLIIKGGDLFVDAAAWIAEISGIPKLIIGATIVSFATTLPEMLVSVFAAVEGKVDMSIGNAVGSVTANIGLIMGIDRILDMTRTAVNITGDAVCTTIVAHQNKALDREIFNKSGE